MRKTIQQAVLAGLIAATVMPVAAQAQINPSERRELQHDRQEFREDRRDAVRSDNWGRNDWRANRNENRNLYRGYGWRSDFRYQTFRPGIRIGVNYYNPRYFINDYARYRLPNPGWNQRWVRHYSDVLLIDTRRGIVIDVIRGFYF